MASVAHKKKKEFSFLSFYARRRVKYTMNYDIY